jgi:hypothetical protein
MDGEIQVSLEREPDCSQAGTIEGDLHQVIVSREEGSGRLLGMASRSVRDAWINGERCRLGYLSQLRVVPGARSRPRLIKGGYQLIRELHQDGQTPYYVTTILEDNLVARRLLERGLKGFPSYQELSHLVTLVVPVRGGVSPTPGISVTHGEEKDLEEILACLERNQRPLQFAPCWTREDLLSPERTRGLTPGDFLLARRQSELVGCLAVWDQRDFKQAVIRGYGPWLRWTRPLVNLFSPLLRTPHLPPVGETLQNATLSMIAVDAAAPKVLRTLLGAALEESKRRGLDHLTLGFCRGNPLLEVAKACLPHREYVSVIYLVYWEDGQAAAARLGARPLHLEVAVL